MKLLKSSLLGSAAAFAAVAGAQAADLPVKKAAPIEYVRVCSAYGAGFFYIPGTDTCIRLSGRARFEYGYMPSYQRTGQTNGDYSGYRGLARINVDARTQTAYGTLRAFVRLESASRTGIGTLRSGTQERIGNAFPATGVDGNGRVQQYFNTDKAFVQFAGFTAGRASSFFDFYAADFEIIGSSLGSNVSSTNLAAYTATLGNGFSATISMEDPSFRRTPTFNPNLPTANANNVLFAISNSPVAVFSAYNAAGNPTAYTLYDAIERNRMPDFVGVLRYDQPWGSAQLSAAVHEVNAGSQATTSTAIFTGGGTAVPLGRIASQYGWAIQGGLKLNLPFIAPGDTLYLQGAYGEGAQLYTGYSSWTGSYIQGTNTGFTQFQQYFSDGVINPFTGRLQLSESFTATASLLHYWSPTWRSAVFASYGEQSFGAGVRGAQGIVTTALGLTNNNQIGIPGTRFFSLSQGLRDTYQVYAGASLIWSPVKDLDIGLEGIYTQVGVRNGRVIDQDKDPTAYTRVNAINAGGAVRTVTSEDTFQIRARVQRDF